MVRLAVAASMSMFAVLGGGRAQPQSDLDEILRKTAAFIAAFERESPAVVSEEAYRQIATFRGVDTIRTLRSDVLVIGDPDAGWVGFRDVFEVDGRPVRDRDERLMTLFQNPHPDRFAQARRIVSESARYNLPIGRYDVNRTTNMPFTPLRFLRGSNQPRSTFRLSGTRRIDGRTYVELTFQERGMPRIIASTDDAAANGRFWIDPESGAIARSELGFETGDTRLRVRILTRVSYGIDERLKVWMPLTMDEEYFVGPAGLRAQATYSNFRRFTVDTSEEIKAP
ncbi:MAG TPA: hypothetical protein VGD94_03225 [Vicinamibacterales bacterium]